MITVLHGDNIATSRTQYKSLQKKDSLVFDGEKLTLDEITQALQTSSLFSEEKSICIENFFSKRKSSKEVDSILSAIDAVSKEHDIVFWEAKTLTKKNPFAKAKIQAFTFPKSLFIFLDALQPGNTTTLLRLYHETLLSTEAELVLSMLTRQVRLLLAVSDSSATDTIDEIKRMESWKQNKLVSQSRFFSLPQLKKLHSELFLLDMKSKTGALAMPIRSTIDFFLASI